jgi:hypothetical protein
MVQTKRKIPWKPFYDGNIEEIQKLEVVSLIFDGNSIVIIEF